MVRENTLTPLLSGLPLRLLMAMTLVVGVLAGCVQEGEESGGDAENGAGDALQVVVSLPVFTSLAEAVAGEHAEVESIVPAGSDAHTYQPTPGDAQLVAEADLVLVNGLGLEEFLDDLIQSAGGVDAPVVELAGEMQDATIEDDSGDQDEEHADEEHDHEHPEGNPHLWLDPGFAIRYVESIAGELSSVDPDNAGDYESNAERYIADIEAFDQRAQDEIAGIPEENRVLVTFHDAFPYFAGHFGLEIAGVVVASPGREPGAREVAELTARVQELGAPAIYVEPQFNPELAETIADEAGAEVFEIYSGAPPEGVGYLEMMETNVERVVEGLS